MKKILFFWPTFNKYRGKNFSKDEKKISYKENSYTTQVDWQKYHFLYSKKWLMDDLLSEIKLDIVENVTQCKNQEIIIIINNLTEKLQYYELENICAKNKVFLFHLGDEFFQHLDLSLSLYSKSYCVFRQYFISVNLKNIIHIPLGYKASNSFYKEKKKYYWSFCGSVYKSSRNDMIEVFKKNFENHFFYKTDFFGDEKSLEADEMYKVISKSIFSLCPQGFYHPETYRVCEILENNSIPIIQDSNSLYDRIFPNNNLIKIKFWSEFLKFYKKLNYEELLNSNIGWYLNYKKELKLKIKTIIYGSNIIQINT